MKIFSCNSNFLHVDLKNALQSPTHAILVFIGSDTVSLYYRLRFALSLSSPNISHS